MSCTASASINCQCIPTPEIAVKPGQAAQGFPANPTGILDEALRNIQDESLNSLVNEQ